MDDYTKRANLLTKMRDFSDAHPTMGDEQLVKYEAIDKEYEALDAKIKREEKLNLREEHEADLNKTTSDPMVGTGENSTENKEYLLGFNNFIQGKDLTEYQNAMTVGVDADGGFLVPEVYQKKIIQRLNTLGRTRSISSVIATSSTLNISLEGDAPTFTWIDEGGIYGETSSTIGREQIKAWKLGGIIKVSEELLQDSMIDFDSYMGHQIALGVDKAESPAFATGDGNSKPIGYTTNAPVGVDSVTQNQDSVTADEWIDIFYDLKDEYRATATWRMTDKTEKSLRKLKDGEGNYIYAPGLTAGERPTLFARPIVIDNHMAELGTGNKFAIIGDFSNYQIADRGQMAIQRLNELFAGNGMVGFRITKRVDAKPIIAEAFNAGQNS